MRPSTRGPSTASLPIQLRAAAALAVTAAVLASACTAVPSRTPTAAPTATPSHAASPRLPTPVPTVVPPSSTPGSSEPAPTGSLVLRLTSCDDACGVTPGTTILDDGRIIWQPPDGRVLQGRLTPAGLARVREAIAGEPALGADGVFVATLRPGAEPIPHGVGSHRFDVVHPAGAVVVDAWDPDSLADQRDAWFIPPEMESLDRLADLLTEPVAWLGADAFETGPDPYQPDRYMVVIDLFPAIGEAGEFLADVDEIDWPFGGPIEAAGDPVGPGADGLPPRCLILTTEDAQALRTAESEAGASRNLRQWTTTIAYDWRRADGFVQVTVIQLLPHEQGACVDIVITPP